VGEARETGNDPLMLFGVIKLVGEDLMIRGRLFVEQFGKVGDGLILHIQVLTVFQHQVDE